MTASKVDDADGDVSQHARGLPLSLAGLPAEAECSMNGRFVFYGDRVTEHVASVDLGVTWEPNEPDAVLLSADSGLSTLALKAHPNDPDDRCVLLKWTGCQYASMAPPNDEAISGHRLWTKGLQGLLWAGIVNDSELIAGLELQNRVHPMHSASLLEGLTHYVLPLKECVVEVVARDLAVLRVEGATAEAAVRART